MLYSFDGDLQIKSLVFFHLATALIILHTTVCTDACGNFSYLEIVSREESNLWSFSIFSEVLAELFRFHPDIKGKNSLKSLNVGLFIGTSALSINS